MIFETLVRVAEVYITQNRPRKLAWARYDHFRATGSNGISQSRAAFVEAMQLLDVLRQVTNLRFSARSESATGWNGDGVGTVVVETPSRDVLIFRETGEWKPAGAMPLRFSNVYRWSCVAPRLIRLEHLRFGTDKPVVLFDLAPDSKSVWSSVSPHECRDDCYSARLQVRETCVTVSWRIVGPQKREEIEYFYGWRCGE